MTPLLPRSRNRPVGPGTYEGVRWTVLVSHLLRACLIGIASLGTAAFTTAFVAGSAAAPEPRAQAVVVSAPTAANIPALLADLYGPEALARPLGMAQVAAPTAQTANAITGKELFTGVVRFTNGGPPCMGCHSIAGIGALGGGALGPDLTTAYSRWGDAGLSMLFTQLPLPTMNPIFSRHPLTPEEQAHLKAFLQQAGMTQRSGQAISLLLGLAGAGATAFLLLVHLLWRRRLRTVRRPLVMQMA
jgi:mono/diheme cytochrome c family protein